MEEEVDPVAEEEEDGLQEDQGQSKKARDIADAQSGRLPAKRHCAF